MLLTINVLSDTLALMHKHINKGIKKMSDDKTFNVKLPRDLWIFLKRKAADEDTSMAKLILKSVEKLKKNADKKLLTGDDANV